MIRLAVAMLLVAALGCRSLDPYLAPGMVVQEARYPENTTLPKAISAREALRAAVGALERRGVRNVRICRLYWIVAPLGAAIIQATGTWDHAHGHFDAFTVSIHDGTEVQYGHPGGKENYIVARGLDPEGAEIFYFSARVDGPQFFRDEQLDDETLREGMFEFVSYEEMKELPRTCGVRR